MSETLYAWIGEDELGPPGSPVGIKQGRVPAGYIPLVVMDFDRAKIEKLAPMMQLQSSTYGKTIRLVRFDAVEDVLTLTPQVAP